MYVFLCMWTYIDVLYMHTCMWSPEDSLINCTPLHILRQGLLLNLELADSSRLAGQQASGIFLSLSSTLELQPYTNVPGLSYKIPDDPILARQTVYWPSTSITLYLCFYTQLYKKPIEFIPFRQLFGLILCFLRYWWVHWSMWITIHSTFIQQSWVPTPSQALCCVPQRVTAHWKRSH